MVQCDEAAAGALSCPRHFVGIKFCFPKGQLTSGPLSPPTTSSSGSVVSRIVILGPRSRRDVRKSARQAWHYNFHPSLTKRLELLRQNKVRIGPLRASEQYREQADTGFRLRLFVTQKCKNKCISLQPSVSVRRQRPRNFKIKRHQIRDGGARQSDRVGGVQVGSQ